MMRKTHKVYDSVSPLVSVLKNGLSVLSSALFFSYSALLVLEMGMGVGDW